MASIEALVARWLPRVCEALPGVALSAGELGPFVAAHPRGAEWAARAPADSALEPLVEFGLACALRRRDRAALDLFEGRYLAGLERT
ncbi:MAG TPA: hypothetical protein VFS00_20355, partial [Polyangiaceae bacterium]|nr:hypothetical protein [Polyangiaceae bacterium]